MRNPDRLDNFYSILRDYHKNFVPDLRFGQLIINFLDWHKATYHNDCFYIEDKELAERFGYFINEL